MADEPEDTSRYYVTYRVDHHPKGLTREQVEAIKPDVSGCHDVMIMASMHTADGGQGSIVLGSRYDGAELTPIDEWKFWTLLTARCAQILPDGDPRKTMCADIFDAICQAIAGGKVLTFTVKVQLSQASNDPRAANGPLMLIYNEDRSIEVEQAATPELIEKIGDRDKAYFAAHTTEEGLLFIETDNEVADPGW